MAGQLELPWRDGLNVESDEDGEPGKFVNVTRLGEESGWGRSLDGEESGWGRSQGAIFSRKWLFLSPSSWSVLGPALTPPQLGGVQGGVGLMAVRMGSATTDVVPAFSRGHLGEPRPPRPPPGPPSGQLSACLIHRRGWGWGRTSSRTSAVLGPAAEPGHLVRVRVSDLPSEAEGGCAPHRKWRAPHRKWRAPQLLLQVSLDPETSCWWSTGGAD